MHGLLRIVLVLLVAMPAWADMPDTAALRVMVERRVEAATEPGLLEVVAFRRMGEAPDPAGSGRIAYFAARLRLTRAHDFGAWTGGNLPALAAACGAGARAIQGAVRGGNAAGDEIRVNGALRLRQEADAWVPLAASAATDATSPGIEQRNTQAERLLDAIRIALATGPRASGADAAPIIEEELAAAWRSIEGRIARLDRGYAVAGGAPGSEYARLAQAMAGTRTGRSGMHVAALPSAGSVENLQLIAAGTATIGIVQADVAALARDPAAARVAGVPALPSLRALAALYPEAVHVIIPAASPAQRLADLTGRPIGVGVEGSGARITAEALLSAEGLDAGATPRVPLAPSDVAAALASGRVGAYVAVSSAPAQAVLRLADTLPIRLLPLAAAAMASAGQEGVSTLLPYNIPARTYPGQDEPLPTLATKAVLVGTDALTSAEVDRILASLFRRPGIAEAGGPAALEIGRATAGSPLPLPFHPGAEAFYNRAD